ncbi:MAG: hypothetical protein Q9225_003545 [Loekoesia sp. 1 TL-2023]
MFDVTSGGYSGEAMPPYHPIFGHVPLMIRLTTSLPRDAHAHYLPDQIRRRYPDLGPIYYLDTWPLAQPILVTTSPSIISQYSYADNLLPKHPGMRKFMRPVTGGLDLVSMEDRTWRTWRRIFNPGFSAQHMVTLIPSMIEELSVFKNVLRDHSDKRDVFSLDEAAINASIDVIGKVALDDKFNAQLAYNDMTAALRDQIRWCQFGSELNIFDRMNPLRPLYQWNNTRRMNRYITAKLQQRYDMGDSSSVSGSKTILDLALRSYFQDQPAEKATRSIDPQFHEYAMSQIKLFIFGGHDTTATTICYLYLLLSRHPSVLRNLREEHNSVFGSEPSEATPMLLSRPQQLNQLPYTLAVIKETLRLFPVVTSPRAGQAGFMLRDSEGRQYPTETCLVWSNHHGLHNNPLFWNRVEEFLPERFQVDECHPLHPTKDAWRPFEFGPRSCIGQELALTELKLVLVLTIREFEVSDAYKEWDESIKSPKGIKTVNGERAYQIHMGSARPSDGFPARVKVAENLEAGSCSSFASQSISDPQLVDETKTGWIAIEPKSAAAFTLQMIHQPTQSYVFPLTARTMIDLLTMDRTTEVLVQSPQVREATLTEVASIPTAIPRRFGGQGGRARIIIIPADLLVGEDVVGVDLSTVLIDLLAVDAGGAGTGFEVEADTGEVGEHVGAPGTFDVLSCVDRRLEMLVARILVTAA